MYGVLRMHQELPERCPPRGSAARRAGRKLECRLPRPKRAVLLFLTLRPIYALTSNDGGDCTQASMVRGIPYRFREKHMGGDLLRCHGCRLAVPSYFNSDGVGGSPQGSGPARSISGPVLGGQNPSVFIQPVQFLEPINDELPGTVYLTTDFTFTLRRSPARTVQ